jgi:hypothetical protein
MEAQANGAKSEESYGKQAVKAFPLVFSIGLGLGLCTSLALPPRLGGELALSHQPTQEREAKIFLIFKTNCRKMSAVLI